MDIKSTSVTTKHPLYHAYEKRWVRSNDVYDGEDKVRSKREEYLKRTGQQLSAKLSGAVVEAEHAYTNYLSRAELPDIFQPSVIGLTSLATRIPWDIDIPPAMEYLYEDAGGGIPLRQMQGKLISYGLKHGRLGHFVDTDKNDNKVRIAFYDPLSIINWKESQGITSLIVLRETEEKDASDIFSHETINVYRVLKLVPTFNDDGVIVNRHYEVELHYPDDNTKPTVEFDDLDFQEKKLPFTCQGSTGMEMDPDAIPLEGMILKCIKYYQLSADLYSDIHASNTSTAVAYGFGKDAINFLGSSALIRTDKSPTEAKFEFVSTDGTGQDNAIVMMDRALEAAEKSSHRMTNVTAGVEAASTLSQKMTSKTATLRTVEENALASFIQDLRYIAIMNGLNPDEVSATSEFKYTEKEVDSVLLSAISTAVNDGNLPEDGAVEYVKANGMYPDMEKDEIIKKMAEEKELREEALVSQLAGVDFTNDDDNQQAANE